MFYFMSKKIRILLHIEQIIKQNGQNVTQIELNTGSSYNISDLLVICPTWETLNTFSDSLVSLSITTLYLLRKNLFTRLDITYLVRQKIYFLSCVVVYAVLDNFSSAFSFSYVGYLIILIYEISFSYPNFFWQ